MVTHIALRKSRHPCVTLSTVRCICTQCNGKFKKKEEYIVQVSDEVEYNFILRRTIFLIFSTVGYSHTYTQCLEFIFLLAVTMRNTSIIISASSAVATDPGSASNKEGPHDENYNSHSET